MLMIPIWELVVVGIAVVEEAALLDDQPARVRSGRADKPAERPVFR
jgi:hypothetical protein